MLGIGISWETFFRELEIIGTTFLGIGVCRQNFFENYNLLGKFFCESGFIGEKNFGTWSWLEKVFLKKSFWKKCNTIKISLCWPVKLKCLLPYFGRFLGRTPKVAQLVRLVFIAAPVSPSLIDLMAGKPSHKQVLL